MKSDSQACIVYFIRHSETEWNIEDRLQGHLDSPLTPRGIKQAENTAEKLTNIPFEAIYASDLGRAMETAKVIAAPHNIQVIPKSDFRERHFGKYDSFKASDYFDTFDHRYRQRNQLPKDERFTFKITPEVESDYEVANRVQTGLRETSSQHRGQTIGIVTHAGVMRIMLIALGLKDYQEVPFDLIPNAGWYAIQVKNSSYSLLKKPQA